MSATTESIPVLRVRRNRIATELQTVAAEMRNLAEKNEVTAADETRVNELDATAIRLQDELKAIDKRLAGTRITQPGRVNHGRIEMNQPSTEEYCNLHKLDPAQLDDGGFKSLGEFLSVLGSGRYDPRIQTLMVAAGASNLGSGGVLVPERFVAQSLHPAGEMELVMPRAGKFAMDAGTLNISALDELSNASGVLYGGFSAQWIEEAGEFTDQTPKTTRITLTRKKLGLFTTASNELLSDSSYEQLLVPALQQAIMDFRDDAFFNGNGVGKPKGILNDAAIIEVAAETGQAADTIVAANLDKMYARIHPRLIRSAEWYTNPTAIPQLLKLVREVGTAGQTIPVLNESNGSFSMYGLPVNLTAKLPVVGDSGDIILADLSQYAVGFGRGIAIDRSEHAKFQTDQTVWRAVWRGDGQGRWKSPFTPRNGDTQSWCVKLADRA